MKVELSTTELRLMTQSLSHCLATCKHKGAGKDEPCEDCTAARALYDKVQALLTSAPKEA
jgi:hypothetical protein